MVRFFDFFGAINPAQFNLFSTLRSIKKTGPAASCLWLVKKSHEQNSNITLAPLDSLELWAKNYRKGDVDAIAKSIVRFGFNGALRVWHGTVLAGNHAFKALQQLKEKGKRPHGIEETGGMWLVPTIDVSHLTEEEAKAFAIADNRTQELGANDEAALAALLEELRVDELHADTGYSDEDLDQLLKKLGQQNAIGIVNGAEASEWVGMPEFHPTVKPFDIIIHCATQEDQTELADRMTKKLKIELAQRGDTRTANYPDSERMKSAGIVLEIAEEGV